MRIDLSEIEKNAALLLSGATSYILNQIASLHDEIGNYQKLVESLNQKIRTLEDAAKSDPALSQK